MKMTKRKQYTWQSAMILIDEGVRIPQFVVDAVLAQVAADKVNPPPTVEQEKENLLQADADKQAKWKGLYDAASDTLLMQYRFKDVVAPFIGKADITLRRHSVRVVKRTKSQIHVVAEYPVYEFRRGNACYDRRDSPDLSEYDPLVSRRCRVERVIRYRLFQVANGYLYTNADAGLYAPRLFTEAGYEEWASVVQARQARYRRQARLGWGRIGGKFIHDILGVDSAAAPADVKAAYRKLAMVHHPDRGGDVERFKEIQAAYAALTC